MDCKIIVYDHRTLLSDVTYLWLRNGQLHRDDDLPAVIWYKEQTWYQNDKRGIKTTNVVSKVVSKRQTWYQGWYQHGELHRANAPAQISSDGAYSWYYAGLPHRVHGPAVYWPHVHYHAWYYLGQCITSYVRDQNGKLYWLNKNGEASANSVDTRSA